MKKPDKPLSTYNTFLNRIAESDLASNARIVGVMLLNKCNKEGWEQPFLMSERSLRHDTGIMKRTELLRSLRQLSEQKFICHNGDYYVLNLATTQKDFLAFSYPEWESDGEKSEEPKKTNGTSKKGKRKNSGEKSEEPKSVNGASSGDYLFDQIDVMPTSTAKLTVAPTPDKTRLDQKRTDQNRLDQTHTPSRKQKKQTENTNKTHEKTGGRERERERENKKKETNDETEEEHSAIDRFAVQTHIKLNSHHRKRLKELIRHFGLDAFINASDITAYNGGKSVEYIATVLCNQHNDYTANEAAMQHQMNNTAKEGDHTYAQPADQCEQSSELVEGFDQYGYAIDGGPFDFPPERLANITDPFQIPDPNDTSVPFPIPQRFRGKPGRFLDAYCDSLVARRLELFAIQHSLQIQE